MAGNDHTIERVPGAAPAFADCESFRCSCGWVGLVTTTYVAACRAEGMKCPWSPEMIREAKARQDQHNDKIDALRYALASGVIFGGFRSGHAHAMREALAGRIPLPPPPPRGIFQDFDPATHVVPAYTPLSDDAAALALLELGVTHAEAKVAKLASLGIYLAKKDGASTGA